MAAEGTNLLDKKNQSPNTAAILEETFEYRQLELTVKNVLDIFALSNDLVIRPITIRNNPSLVATFIYVDGLVAQDAISDLVIKPLMQQEQFDACVNQQDAIKLIVDGNVYFAAIKKRENICDLLDDILAGSAALIFDSINLAITFEAKGFEKRSISEPTGENVIKGAKDSFVETIRVNTATCRRKIKSPNLVIEETIVGRHSKTQIAIVYMKNIANKELVMEVKQRLDSIDIDRAITSGYIEEFIIDNKNSVFPQVLSTERPDKFCSNIMDGRVGIIIDGTPISFIIPATLMMFIQAPEDYAQQYIISSILRYLRYTAMFVTLLLPGFFVCITTFHLEMIPTELAISIAASREGVPFPMAIEVFIMLAAFELLVEAGLRLPKTLGQTISIVGAVVVGQSAVQAKLLSPATVVVVSLTAITSFTMPNQDFSNALRVWRLFIFLLSSFIGIFGLTSGLIFLIFHWSQMETYGVPYLSPFVSDENKKLQDTLFRSPLSKMKFRPDSLSNINKKRMK
jgi:spore germination protein KA